MLVRDVRLYLIGVTASSLGDSAMSLAAGIWVKGLTGSSSEAALVSVCVFVPSLLAPLAGVVADRFSRRSVIQVANLAAAVVVLLLLFVRDSDQVWLIFAVMLWYGATLVIIDPAETALFADLVPVAERGGLNGLRLTLQEGCKLLAPLAGAGLFALIGGGGVAFLDAATFFLAFAAVTLLHFRELRPDRPPRHWRAEVVDGLQQVRRSPELALLCLVGALAMFTSGLALGAQYSLVDALHRSPTFLGVLVSTLGAGSIIAGLTSGRVMKRAGETGLATLGLANAAIGYLLRASGWLPTVLLGSFVQGFALPWIVIAVITAGQRLAAGELQGRVAATITLVLFAPQPVAQAAGAGLVGALDYRAIYLLAAAASLATAGYLWSATPREPTSRT